MRLTRKEAGGWQLIYITTECIVQIHFLYRLLLKRTLKCHCQHSEVNTTHMNRSSCDSEHEMVGKVQEKHNNRQNMSNEVSEVSVSWRLKE